MEPPVTPRPVSPPPASPEGHSSKWNKKSVAAMVGFAGLTALSTLTLVGSIAASIAAPASLFITVPLIVASGIGLTVGVSGMIATAFKVNKVATEVLGTASNGVASPLAFPNDFGTSLVLNKEKLSADDCRELSRNLSNEGETKEIGIDNPVVLSDATIAATGVTYFQGEFQRIHEYLKPYGMVVNLLRGPNGIGSDQILDETDRNYLTQYLDENFKENWDESDKLTIHDNDETGQKLLRVKNAKENDPYLTDSFVKGAKRAAEFLEEPKNRDKKLLVHCTRGENCTTDFIIITNYLRLIRDNPNADLAVQRANILETCDALAKTSGSRKLLGWQLEKLLSTDFLNDVRKKAGYGPITIHRSAADAAAPDA